jgi:hypothetical protein
MYIPKDDVVIEITEFPRASVGAPCPLIFADGSAVWLAYYIAEGDPRFEEKYSKIWTDSDELCIEDCFAVVRMNAPYVWRS